MIKITKGYHVEVKLKKVIAICISPGAKLLTALVFLVLKAFIEKITNL